MPLQNRVTPAGEIIATSARGTVMGNRGRLHDDARRIVRTSASQTWLICRLEFNGRRREVMSPQSYTELFFLDEPTALAAGHRPCAECRRDQYLAYKHAVGAGSARELDQLLRESRRAPQETVDVHTLPNGVFVLRDSEFRLKWDGNLHRWSPDAYDDAMPLVDGQLPVITPALTVEALKNGYTPTVPPLDQQPPALPR